MNKPSGSNSWKPWNPVANLRLLKRARAEKRTLGAPTANEGESTAEARIRIQRDIRRTRASLIATVGLLVTIPANIAIIRHFMGTDSSKKEELIQAYMVAPEQPASPIHGFTTINWLISAKSLFIALAQLENEDGSKLKSYTKDLEFFFRQNVEDSEAPSETLPADAGITFKPLASVTSGAPNKRTKWFQSHNVAFYDPSSRTILTATLDPATAKDNPIDYSLNSVDIIFALHEARSDSKEGKSDTATLEDPRVREPLVTQSVIAMQDSVLGIALKGKEPTRENLLVALKEIAIEGSKNLIKNATVMGSRQTEFKYEDPIVMEGSIYRVVRWLLTSRGNETVEAARPILLELAQNPSLIKLPR